VSLLNNALAAIKSFSAAGLEQILNRASTELSRPAFLRQMVAPLIEQIGIYWQSGQIEAIQEHLATAVIRTFLGNSPFGALSSGYILYETPFRFGSTRVGNPAAPKRMKVSVFI
jgi:hypothetical protein